jgi:hypothetical protein
MTHKELQQMEHLPEGHKNNSITFKNDLEGCYIETHGCNVGPITFAAVKLPPGCVAMGIGKQLTASKVLLSSSLVLIVSLKKAIRKGCSTCHMMIFILLSMLLILNEKEKCTVIHVDEHMCVLCDCWYFHLHPMLS